MAAGCVALAAAAAALPGGPATAGPSAPSVSAPTERACTVAEPNVSFCGYFFTGHVQYFQAPPWLTEVTIAAVGARGASGVGPGAAAGGMGGKVLATAHLAPNAKVPILVGGTPVPGSGEGGWPDGGFSRGGGGGGSSSVLSGELNKRLVVAAGGGGGGTRGWAVPDPGVPGIGGAGGAPGPTVPGFGVPGAAGDGVQGQHGSGSIFTAGGGYGATASAGGAGGGASSGASFGGCLLPWFPGFATGGEAGAGRGGRGGYLQFLDAPCAAAGGYGGGGGGGFRTGGGGGAGVSAGAGGGGGSSYAPFGDVEYGRNNLTPGEGMVAVAVHSPLGWKSAGVTRAASTVYDAPVSAAVRRLPSTAQTADLFGIDHRGAAFHQSWTPGTSVSDVRPLGGIFHAGSRLAAVSSGVGRIDVVGRALHGGLFHNVWNGQTWSGWKPVPGAPDGFATSSPALTSWGIGRLDVFVRDQQGQLKHGWSDNGGAGWRWETFGGQVVGDLAAVSWGPGRIDLFSAAPASSDGLLQHQWWDGSSWSGWKPWTDPDMLAMSSPPTVSSAGPGQLDLWFRDTSGHLVQRGFRNHAWSAWADRGPVPSRQGEPVAGLSLSDGTSWALSRGELDDAAWFKRMP